MIDMYQEYIKGETLAEIITKDESLPNDIVLNDENVSIIISRIEK